MWEKNKKAKYYTNTAGTFKLCHIYASIEFWAGNISGEHQSLATVINEMKITRWTTIWWNIALFLVFYTIDNKNKDLINSAHQDLLTHLKLNNSEAWITTESNSP